MHNKKLYRLVRTALFAALVCVATLAVQIRVPATGGYLNLGDCFVLLSAFCLGPIPGALASGIGSMLADFITGYVQYAPATFVIKGVMALAAGMICRAFLKDGMHAATKIFVRFLSALLAETVMAVGYRCYEAFLLGYGAGALLAVPMNLAQGGLGISLSLVLVVLLQKIPSVRRALSE